MFRGQFEHAIDAKGRTSLPARYRATLPPADLPLVVTKALFDPCLQVFPLSAWEELEAKIAALPQFDDQVVRLRRSYLSPAVECEVDPQGRILIPPALRQHAGLQHEVFWAGQGKYAELWARARWEETQRLTAADLGELKAAFATFRL